MDPGVTAQLPWVIGAGLPSRRVRRAMPAPWEWAARAERQDLRAQARSGDCAPAVAVARPVPARSGVRFGAVSTASRADLPREMPHTAAPVGSLSSDGGERGVRNPRRMSKRLLEQRSGTVAPGDPSRRASCAGQRARGGPGRRGRAGPSRGRAQRAPRPPPRRARARRCARRAAVCCARDCAGLLDSAAWASITLSLHDAMRGRGTMRWGRSLTLRSPRVLPRDLGPVRRLYSFRHAQQSWTARAVPRRMGRCR